MDSWRDFQSGIPEISGLEKLARRAEKERDAHTLAFAAIELRDPQKRTVRLQLAHKAVAINASLSWIYVSLLDKWLNTPIPDEWPQLLMQWDHDNAVPHLLEAERIARNIRTHWQETHPGINFPYGRIYPNGRQIDTRLLEDRQWLAAMDSALDAPRFDSYFILHSELNREVMGRQRIDKPTLAMLALASHPFLFFEDIMVYSDALLIQGQQAEDTGNLQAAADRYWRVAHFAERMRMQTQSNFETLIAGNIQEKAYGKLQPLLAKMGRTSEGGLVAYNRAEVQQTRLAFKPNRTIRGALPTMEWPALIVQLCALSVVLLSCATIFPLVFLLSIRSEGDTSLRKLLCVAADLGPVMLFLACGAFLISYHPFAQAFHNYIHTATSMTGTKQFYETFLGLASVPSLLPSGPLLRIKLWWCVIGLGSLISAWLLKRLIRPHSAPLPLNAPR